MCCFVRLLSLSADSYVMKTFVITVNVYSLNRPCVQCSQICTCFQCVPFVSMKNMDCSEGDFALILLAEEAAMHEKKKSEQINKHTNTLTNTQMLIIL